MNKQNFLTIFEKQKDFSEKFFREKYGLNINEFSNDDKIKWSKEFVLSATKELYEALDEIPWKTHRYIEQNNNAENLLEEGVDAFKFLLNLFIINGFTPEQVVNKFFDKSEVVEIRYKQEKNLQKLKQSGEKVVVIDIDGVLNNYPINFIEYTKSKGHNFNSVKEFKKIDFLTYAKLKHEFRSFGFEASCNVNEGVLKYLHELNKRYKIVLLTARPYEKYARLFSDTLIWIENWQIPCDFVFFSKNKEEWLIKNLDKNQVYCIIDDQIDNVNTLIKYFDNVNLVKNLELYSKEDFNTVNKDIKIFDSILDIDIK